MVRRSEAGIDFGWMLSFANIVLSLSKGKVRNRRAWPGTEMAVLVKWTSARLVYQKSIKDIENESVKKLDFSYFG